MIKTVTLTSGQEQRVDGLGGQNTVIINKSAETVYASASSGVVPKADGVAAVAAESTRGLNDTGGTIYLLGNGEVEVCGTNYDANFSSAPACGGGTIDLNGSRFIITL